MLVTCHSANTLLDCLDSIDYSTLVVLVDQNTKKHCLPLLPQIDHILIQVPALESSKSLAQYGMVIQALLNANVDRHGILINLGGGMISDLGGFVASTYKRGIRFIHIPTTLLSMVDAAHGGKTGINHNGIKNSIGTFKLPMATIIFADFLKTLNHNDIQSGWVEMFKHGLITSQRLYDEAKSLIKSKHFTSNAIKLFAQTKLTIVDADYLESGERKKLNLGHTFGHAFESYFSAQQLSHGYAVLLGLWCEISLSPETEIKAIVLNDISSFIHQFTDSTRWVIDEFDSFYEWMSNDKKNTKSVVSMVSWHNFDHQELDHNIDRSEALLVIQKFNTTFG